MFARLCLLLAVLQITAARALAAEADRVVVVRGTVCDRESGQGVAGAEIVLSNGRGETIVRSDAAGNYKGRISAGQAPGPELITGVVKQVPTRYAQPHRAFNAPVLLEDDAEELTLPKIELAPARSLRGQVVDAEGRPVPEAEVQVCWLASEPWLGSAAFVPKRLATTADAQGEFLLAGFDPPDRLLRGRQGARITAGKGRLATARLQEFAEGDEKPVVLRLDQRQATPLEGRVVDADGRPVAGAEVQFWTQWQSDNAFQLGYAPISVGGDLETLTDAEGRFRTSGGVGREVDVAAWVRAEGFLPARTPWRRAGEMEVSDVEAGNMKTARFADVTLTRLRIVAGRVLDRQGRPLAGVRVFQAGDGVQRTETISDDGGSYELPRISEGPAFLFAQQRGFRFHGQEIEPGARQADVTLARVDEPAEPLPPQPPPISRDEELKLVRNAYRPYLEQALGDGDARERMLLLGGWIWLDPGDAQQYIDGPASSYLSADARDMLRLRAAKLLLHDAPEDALELVESTRDVNRKLLAYVSMTGAAPASQPELKRRLAERVLLNNKSVQEPGRQAIWLHCAADVLLDLGDEEHGRTILAEAQKLAEALPLAGGRGSARGYVAEVLAPVDLPAAIDLMHEIGEDEFRDQTYGRMAFRIAASQPAEAERLLERMVDRDRFEQRLVPVCWRMAPADPLRARRLADRLSSPYLEAHALGLMARSCAATDSAQARLWLDEAFEILERMVSAREERLARDRQNAAMIAGALVEPAERIDPQLVPEYFWRAVACRGSHSADAVDQVQSGTAALAMSLAKYHRTIARRLVEPIVDERLGGLETLPAALAFKAVCFIDPRWACELLSELDADSAYARLLATTSFAWHFGVRPENRVEAEARNCHLFWLPGRPENAFQIDF